ncbi:glutamate receptor ionotropic, delta-2-like [Limulus polyphemus]|uniref:Glutamate receptor ionotropic, delta-2-like n=1 Tax=Limulus polyphemus TaxID=6850 RepID=A0ABM1TGP7_LIMPO|nr:glutamate receptor ionotropic, delta-2-like [Limulus polyphemus]
MSCGFKKIRKMFGNVSSKLFLRICALNWKPWVSIDQSVNGTKLSGPMANVMENLSKLMNFRYEIYMPEDKHWGMEYPDGTWSGMIGMLHNNEADLALGPFATTYARSKVATFTSNLATGYLAVMAGRMKRKTTNVFGYILTFDWQVWFVLVIAMLVMIALSLFIDAITDPKYRSKPMIRKRTGEYFWSFYSSIFCEGLYFTDSKLILSRTMC